MPSNQTAFDQVVRAAIADISQHGFDSMARVQRWMMAIKQAAIALMVPEAVAEQQLKDTLVSVYTKLLEQGEQRSGIYRLHSGISPFTLQQFKPRLRNELDRRIMSAADLIKLNREQAVTKTLQRFGGWASSIPDGGSKVVDKRDTTTEIRKALASLPYEERRVNIDQGHKLVASISEILAHDAGALAGIWHSHWQQPGYNYREDHKERDELVFVVRGNWALAKGLMKVGPAGYTDQITKPGEEVFCRCFYQWIYNLSDLPAELLTAKGRAGLAGIRTAA